MGRKKNKKIIQICYICHNTFIHKRNTIIKCCSKMCRKKYLQLPEIKNIQQENTKKSMLKKYGTTSYSTLPEFSEKIKKTKLERYGDENYVNFSKAKSTKLKKYGNENYNNLNKNRKTKLEKYGNENYNNRNKFSQTMIDKYNGIGLQRKSVYDSAQKSLQKKYHVKYYMQHPDFIKKVKNTCIEKYGSEQYIQSENYKSKNFADRLEKIESILMRNNISLVNNYTKSKLENNYISYDLKCNTCNLMFSSHFANGNIPLCPSCNKIDNYSSSTEKEIFLFLHEILPNTEIKIRDRKIIYPYELDLYMPSLKIAIELNGNYWHSELGGGKDKNYHLNKTNLCLDKNIKLIQIFEDEWINNDDVIKNRLKHYLKLHSKKIYARKCEVKIINSAQKNTFLNTYHTQRTDKSSIKYGLFYNNELISVMTFSDKRIIYKNSNQNKNNYELVRFCTSFDINIVGGFSKLLQHFIDDCNPSEIISYVDRRFSEGEFYNQLGFEFLKNTVPNYWYINKKDYLKRYHRFGFRKNILHKKLEIFDKNLTEWQNMQLNKYDRIWDCGSKKYIWKKKTPIF